MSVVYKIDVLEALKEKGYSSYVLRKKNLISERVVQRIRQNEPVSWLILGRICKLLECRIEDIIVFNDDGKDFIDENEKEDA